MLDINGLNRMHVFLDTNIFHNDWHLKLSSTRLLFHYLNNEAYHLLLSDLVVEETENLHRRTAQEAGVALQKKSHILNGLFPDFKPSVPDFDGLAEYRLKPLLEKKVDWLLAVEYESIPQSTVVKRAISARRPFRENEKGYRDTLIWLSLLNYLKENNIVGEVAFISTNTTDFMAPDKKGFHPDLLEDIQREGLSCELVYFDSLANFLQNRVDSEAHLIDESKVEDLVERYLEDESVNVMENLTETQIIDLEDRLFRTSGVLSNASPISATLIEGMEDLFLDSTIKLDHDNIYVTCTYNLRIVELAVDIPFSDYKIYEDHISASSAVFDVSISANIATLRAIVRPYFSASFTFNTLSDDYEGFSVDEIKYRVPRHSKKNLFRAIYGLTSLNTGEKDA
ncbi:PIN domain-containing protein [Pseudomonas sp. 18175]|uniref:PIN domain-containing protein n=1 Tax=Pseudomonas sp. 18175 TaxID=3390056 RepID=UPI003D241077